MRGALDEFFEWRLGEMHLGKAQIQYNPDSEAALEEATLDLFRELARQDDSCTKEQVDTADAFYIISLVG